MIKRNSCGKALDIARVARDMLGGVHDVIIMTTASTDLWQATVSLTSTTLSATS